MKADLSFTGRVIALFVVFGILAIGFAAVQFWKQDNATVPPRILKKRSIAFGSWFALCLGGSFFVLIYYIPIWFQAIEGVSAVESGIRNLPMILGLVIISIVSGIGITLVGYYTPFMILVRHIPIPWKDSLLLATFYLPVLVVCVHGHRSRPPFDVQSLDRSCYVDWISSLMYVFEAFLSGSVLCLISMLWTEPRSTDYFFMSKSAKSSGDRSSTIVDYRCLGYSWRFEEFLIAQYPRMFHSSLPTFYYYRC